MTVGSGLTSWGRRALAVVAFAGLAAVAVRAADDPAANGRPAASTQPAPDGGRAEVFVTRVYDVGSLTIDVPSFTDAPSFMMSGGPVSTAAGGGGGGGGGGGLFAAGQPQGDVGRRQAELFEDLVKLISETIAPDSWRDNNGTATGTIREANRLLVIYNTEAVHRQVAALLDEMGRRVAVPVRVRAHYVIADRSALEPLLTPADTSPARSATAPADPFAEAGRLPGGAVLVVDPAALAKLPATHLRGEVSCLAGQRVYVLSADSRAYTSDVNPGAAEGVAYLDPSTSVTERGMVLDAQTTLSRDGRSAIVTLRNEWKDHRVAPGRGGRATVTTTRPATAPAAASARADGIAERVSDLRTTVRVPVGKMMLVGGMTIDPTSPASLPLAADGGPATRPVTAPALESKPQLYLFIEVTAG